MDHIHIHITFGPWSFVWFVSNLIGNPNFLFSGLFSCPVACIHGWMDASQLNDCMIDKHDRCYDYLDRGGT